MAAYDVDSFSLTEEQLNDLGGDPSQITYIKVWDPTSPSGSMIVALSPTVAQVVCPKPCG